MCAENVCRIADAAVSLLYGGPVDSQSAPSGLSSGSIMHHGPVAKAMKKSMKATSKRRRDSSTTGRDPLVTSRMPTGLVAEVKAWATANDTTLSEAVRRLVELGLTVRSKAKQGSAARAERAKELASKAIDNLTAATPESNEKASRKGNLIKGPEEFREVRVDRPKPKRG